VIPTTLLASAVTGQLQVQIWFKADDVPTAVSSGELYDPASSSFTAAGDLHTPRELHTATLLPSGKVLVTGRIDWFPGPESPEGSPLDTAELFGPNSTSSTITGVLSSPRRGQTATLLLDGRILIIGGVDGNGNALATAEVYTTTP
jgi:hypothetical protein